MSSDIELFAVFDEELKNQLHVHGLSDQDINSLLTENGDLPVEKIAEVLNKHFLISDKTHFQLSVDYSCPVEKAIEVGRYDGVNEYITSKNFLTERSGQADCVIQLLHFKKGIMHDKVLEETENQRFRRANLHELLSLGAKYPDLQRQFPILALGSEWQGLDKDLGVPCLSSFGSGQERELKLYRVTGFWPEFFRFAVVRK